MRRTRELSAMKKVHEYHLKYHLYVKWGSPLPPWNKGLMMPAGKKWDRFMNRLQELYGFHVQQSSFVRYIKPPGGCCFQQNLATD